MSPHKSPSKNAQTTPDELRGQLDYLKLQFMREHAEQLLGQAADDGWSHAEFLARLVEGEAALRRDRARERRIRQARFPVLKTLDQFDFTWPVKINRLAIGNLFRLKFIQDKANAILVGGVGLGKSHLAIALGYAAVRSDYIVYGSVHGHGLHLGMVCGQARRTAHAMEGDMRDGPTDKIRSGLGTR